MSTNFQVLTIGDAMITMNPVTTGPLRYVTHFERKLGGAELNFAIGCARLGLNAKWVSRLGKDEFGRVIYNFAKGEGVDVSEVEFVENHPTSVNFKEISESGAGKTFYYRHHSPILTLKPSDIHDDILSGVSLVHITGVFLAIDDVNFSIAERILQLAKSKGIPVSFDPNIRLKLWTIEEARETYKKIFPYVNILLTGLDEIRLITGFDSTVDLEKFAKNYEINSLVIKDGEKGSKVYQDGKWTEAKAFKVRAIDTVGAGDGFDAGFVYGYLHNYSLEETLQFANGVGALVTTVSGDNEGLPYLEEVNAFIHNENIVER
ncbi:sugar kinase [Psychrobacillus soli]|uniref:Sugar kinase n=1 Tax=Psychrobacillus soli TaxID=1543965 RepID=A0A544TLG3_9BACI|nr:sugar kinase [Psychrobacillus soli]TQR18255.1 sugar kinase [Psychrobacillus soli]